MSQVYGFNDLADLTWYGDSHMAEFLTQWDHLVKRVEEPMSDNVGGMYYSVRLSAIGGHRPLQPRRPQPR